MTIIHQTVVWIAIMAKSFGQVLESYELGAEHWITIWEFEQKRKFSVSVEDAEVLKEGAIVEIDRLAGEIDTMREISSEQMAQLEDAILPKQHSSLNHPVKVIAIVH